MEKGVDYLSRHIKHEIKLDTLCRHLGTNRNKLGQAFNMHLGKTVFEWLREARINYAAELLKNTSLSILQVSERSGYPDSNNFSTAFKRIYNKSPREFRQMQRMKVNTAKSPVQKSKVITSQCG